MTQSGHAKGFQTYRRLLTYAWRYHWALALATVGMIGLAITSTAFVAMMQPLVDGGFVDRDPDVIRLIPIAIIALFAFRGVSSFTGEYMLKWTGRKVVFDIRNAVFTQLVHLPCGFYDKNPTGTLLAKLIFDVEQLSRAATQAVFVIVRDGLTIVGILVWMLYLEWKLTLMVMALGPIAGVVVRIMSHRLRKYSRAIQQTVGEISRVAQEATEGHRVVKAFLAQHTETDTFSKVNNKNRKQFMRRVAIASAGVAISLVLAAGAIALVLYLAISAGKASAGAFVSYTTAMMWLLNPIKRIMQVNEVLQTGIAAAQSVFAVLDAPREPDPGTRSLDSVCGQVKFENVVFRYPSAEYDALRGISFRLEPGKTVALVGPSGSGKTTVANLVPRFYAVTKGAILVDDVNINDLTLANLRHHIAIVGQETLLFDDTIRHNVAYGGAGQVDEEKLMGAIEAAQVMEFMGKLPDGLNTMVGEKGLRLSGGQRQRIAIARALYKDAPILILDEATSALDSESERAVQAALEALRRNRTTLVIAHRLATVENADRIIVLANGHIVEQGTHQELLAANSQYADLHRLQFSERPN